MVSPFGDEWNEIWEGYCFILTSAAADSTIIHHSFFIHAFVVATQPAYLYIFPAFTYNIGSGSRKSQINLKAKDRPLNILPRAPACMGVVSAKLSNPEVNMLQFEEQRLKLLEYGPQLDELNSAMGIEGLKEELASLDAQSAQPNFWEDLENSQAVLQKSRQIKDKLETYGSLRSLYDDTLELIALAEEMGDESVYEEVEKNVSDVGTRLETQKLATLLTGEYDSKNAILTFHAGAGGTEAQDWVQMLYRMYTHWAERHSYKWKVLDYLAGDEAGIKSVSILIEGPNVYGYLRSEAGVHRLVRVSPFDSSGRRHTSFASLEVMPEIDEDVNIALNEADLRIDTYRASGAGGQHVNKTESAVRITHLPTGLVTSCQNERSQRQNREVAMKMLKSKLAEIKQREHLSKIEDIKGEQKKIEWGSQIRSYVFMPYTLVKDHRTNFEAGNIGAVMDGDLDGFMGAYLRDMSLGKL